MELRNCPLCGHNSGKNCERGRYHKYGDRYYYDAELFFIKCDACHYKVKAEHSLIDAQLAWNNDRPTAEDYKYYVEYGEKAAQTWEQEQPWLNRND